MNYGPIPGNPAATPKRRELRLPATLNVRILGIDANGKAFHQPATTLEISLSGARITGLAAKLNPGDIVGLQSGGAKSRFKVAWVKGNRDGSSEIGLQCMEPRGCPWRDQLRQQAKEGDRRSDERYACNGSATLESISFSAPIWGTLRDVSERGCYVQCTQVAAVGEILSGRFTVNGVQLNAVAEVSNAVLSVGMGLQWTDLGCDGEARLNGILRALALNSMDSDSSRKKALGQANKLHQLLTALQERLESEHCLVQAETIGKLDEAQEDLMAALKSMQS
ncbi:MAG: PilZ domain-containing protein [Candidatus Korobacteraceae bacterium]